ncbi:uncharacterized protein LOC135682887 [Rhopilema esculentum]|uniref:uncharacterized protein LOC135682887 n=1 Tax=Rhopilema esculentum TaxID=499914 RepID=UPI0031D689EF
MATSSWPILSASLEFTAQYKLPVQFDTAIQIHLTNESHRDEDEAFSKVVTLPTSILVVRIYGCTNLSHADFKIVDDILVYARVISGALGKSTHHTTFAKGKPVWNEYLFFPVQLTGNPKSKSNKLTVLIIWRDEAQDKKTGVSSHKLLGKAEFLLYKLARHIKIFETIDITNRKQQNVGQLQIEMALVSGPFGFGQAFQIENNLHSPEEMVKCSLYPRIAPSYERFHCRGLAVVPRKVQPSSIIPFNNRTKNFEPTISETHGMKPLLHTQKSFSVLASRLTRLPALHSGFLQQKTRTSRIAYLRGTLRYLDKVDNHLSLNEANEKPVNQAAPAKQKNDSCKEAQAQSADIVSLNDGLHVISEDQELEDKEDTGSIPHFLESIKQLEESRSHSSTVRSASVSSSLHSVDLTPEYYTRKHFRSSSLLGALFKSTAYLDE